MRIVAVIPHHFHRGPDSGPRSRPEATTEERQAISALSTSVLALHANFGASQHCLDYVAMTTRLANQSTEPRVEVIIPTARDRHLVDQILVPPSLYRHCPLDVEPALLGLECRRILRDRLKDPFDYYCCLEDRIIIRDPLFFEKQSWFLKSAGIDCVLAPSRYRIEAGPEFQRVYFGGGEAAAGPGPESAPELEILGRRISFCRTANPQSNAYFLSRRQMERWASQPQFLDHQVSTPEPAAFPAALLDTFRVYRPSADSANFLEVEHFYPNPDSKAGTWFIPTQQQRPPTGLRGLVEKARRHFRRPR